MEHASRAVPKERAGRNLGLNPAVTEAKVLVGATSRPLRMPLCQYAFDDPSEVHYGTL